MTKNRGVSRLLLVAGGAVVLAGLVPMTAAGAATPPKPSASCKTPVFSVTPLTVTAGSKVTVSGVNFSGCPAQGSTAKPTPVLTVKIGVQSASKMGAILATTKTTASGTFNVMVTVPALASGGVPKLELAAAATDPATGLTYAGVAVLAYNVATPVASPTAPGGGVPTAVPAGSGGIAATTGTGTRDAQLGLGAAGVALAGAGAFGVARRRKHTH